LTGQNQISFAFHPESFDEQDVPAHCGPGETGRHADLILFQHFFRDDFRGAEKFVQVTSRNAHNIKIAFAEPARDLAAD
jgi:hypothetical protein